MEYLFRHFSICVNSIRLCLGKSRMHNLFQIELVKVALRKNNVLTSNEIFTRLPVRSDIEFPTPTF